jgi:hypothetical protein
MSLSLDAARRLLTHAPSTPVGYTLEDVEKHFGVRYSPEQRAALAEIPFSEETLKACPGTHMLLPGFPLSLLDIHDRHADLFFMKKGGWYAYAGESFSRAPIPPRWHLLRTEPVPDSFSKTWDGQVALLAPGEEVPSAALVAFASALHFLASEQRLFQYCYVRTSDRSALSNRVYVGFFDAVGFTVYDGTDDCRFGNLGLASSRQVP